MKMLEMTKKVLKSVSFDKKLFSKELVKSKKWLCKEELIILKTWCLLNFSHSHEFLETINEYLY